MMQKINQPSKAWNNEQKTKRRRDTDGRICRLTYSHHNIDMFNENYVIHVLIEIEITAKILFI